MNRLMNGVVVLVILLVGVVIGLTVRLAPDAAVAQGGCQTFKETGKTVCGRFLQYWQQNGGLLQQGYPISNEFTEVSDLDGKPYTVQYFERAVFEKHPENKPPYDVLLSQLGTFQFKRKYPNGEPAGGSTPTPVPPPPIVGQVIDVEGLDGQKMQITVRSVQETTQLKGKGSYSQYRARGKYVVLFITAANTSDRNNLGWMHLLRLVDDKERRYVAAGYQEQEAASEQYFRDPPDTWVDPGKSAEEVLVFDVVPDAANYKLVLAQVPQP